MPWGRVTRSARTKQQTLRPRTVAWWSGYFRTRASQDCRHLDREGPANGIGQAIKVSGNQRCFHEKREDLSLESGLGDHAKLYCCIVCCAARARRGVLAGPVTASNGRLSASGSENPSGSTGLSRRADCTLSRSHARSGSGGFDVSLGNYSTPAMVGEEQEPEGQSAGRCCRETALGCKRPSPGLPARRGQSLGERHSVDH